LDEQRRRATSTSPVGLTDADHWEWLVWVALRCAQAWHRMSQGDAVLGSSYHETVERARRLVLITTTRPDGGSCGWTFLTDELERRHEHERRHERLRDGSTAVATAVATAVGSPRAAPSLREADTESVRGEGSSGGGEGSGAPASASSRAPGVLLLRSLLGFELWGNLDGLELREQPPRLSSLLPSRLYAQCNALVPSAVPSDGPSAVPSEAWGARARGGCASSRARFACGLDRATLTMALEWFLLDVARAAPPALLWAAVEEPITATARERIRATISALRTDGEAEGVVEDGGSSDGRQGSSRSSGPRGTNPHSPSGPRGTSPHSPTASPSLSSALLAHLLSQTQIERLIDEMDAADEVRLMSPDCRPHQV
jgi:hypothetical protein